jgi:glycosyltransferase involved in cell wall biosynthesis
MPVLRGQIEALHLRDHILLPGFRQYEELPVYYALAGCYIQASTAEPWGLTVNEAMASGLPVLVSNVCGCAKDLLREAENGFALDPFDIADMAQKMLRVSGAGCDREAMGRMSRRIISSWGCDCFGENLWKAAERACRDPVRGNDRTGALILKALVFLK